MKQKCSRVTPDFAEAQDHPPNGDRHGARATSRTSPAGSSSLTLASTRTPSPAPRMARSCPYWAKRLGRDELHRAAGERAQRHPALPARRRPSRARRALLHGHRRNVPALSERQAPPAPHRDRRGPSACIQRRDRRIHLRASRDTGCGLRFVRAMAFPVGGLASLLIAIPFSRSVAAFPESGGPATYGRVFGAWPGSSSAGSTMSPGRRPSPPTLTCSFPISRAGGLALTAEWRASC